MLLLNKCQKSDNACNSSQHPVDLSFAFTHTHTPYEAILYHALPIFLCLLPAQYDPVGGAGLGLLKQPQALCVLRSQGHPAPRKTPDLPETRSPFGNPSARSSAGGAFASRLSIPAPRKGSLPHSRAPSALRLDRAARARPGIPHPKVVSLQRAILAWSRPRRLRCAPRSGAAGGSPPTRKVRLQDPLGPSFVGCWNPSRCSPPRDCGTTARTRRSR